MGKGKTEARQLEGNGRGEAGRGERVACPAAGVASRGERG